MKKKPSLLISWRIRSSVGVGSFASFSAVPCIHELTLLVGTTDPLGGDGPAPPAASATGRGTATDSIAPSTSSGAATLSSQDPAANASSPADHDAGNGDDGLSSGTIAGIVIGAVACLATIAGALFIGFRWGRRHALVDNQEARPKKSFKETINSLPRPTIVWSRPGNKPSADIEVQNAISVPQINSPGDTAGTGRKTPVELPSPVPHSSGDQAPNISQPVSTRAHTAAEMERPGVELPAGPEAQGWARSESHPLPYEADSTKH